MSNWQKHFVHTGANGADEYASVMAHTNSNLKALFETLDKPYSGLEPAKLEQAINAIDLDSGNQSLKSVIDTATDLVAKNSIIVQHPNCIAHLHTPPLMPAIVAEAIIAVLNQSMDSWDQASAATYVEQKVVDWLCEKYELGEKADGIFTSGGTQSNQMGLLLARDWVADKISGHSIQKLGLPEYAADLRILCSKKSHFTVQKTASIMGLGERAVLCVDTHEDGTMKVDSLKETIAQAKEEGLIPFALVATAGTTDHGAIDDIDALADIAENEDLWLHVDGAYGGSLILSSYKSRLKGIERASSVSVDFHKLFYQTISCGAVLLKDKANFKYLLHHADYLNREHDELPNLVDKSIATTKRFDALKVFMTMQNVGPAALGEMYDHLLEQTQQVAKMVEAHPHFELLATPSLSTVLFRVNPGMNGTEGPIAHSPEPHRLKGTGTTKITGTGAPTTSTETPIAPSPEPHSPDLDVLNQKVRVEALTRGIAVLGETTVDGKSALKFTILNPCLTLSDFENLLNQIDTLASELAETL